MQQIIKFGLGSMKKATEYRPFQTGTTRCIVDLQGSSSNNSTLDGIAKQSFFYPCSYHMAKK